MSAVAWAEFLCGPLDPAGLILAADPIAGLLTGEPVAAYGDFRSARTLLSRSLPRSGTGRGAIRR